MLTPISGIRAHANRLPSNGKCQDHGDILQSNSHLTTRQVETMCLRPPSINKSCDSTRDHMWRRSGDKLHEREKSGLLDIRPIALIIWHLVATNPMRPQVQPLQPLQYNNKVKNRDFYFCALGSLVILSFPQLLSFYSVFPKPLSKTLTRSLDGRNPVQLTVPC
jgi:hypothetical protein